MFYLKFDIFFGWSLQTITNVIYLYLLFTYDTQIYSTKVLSKSAPIEECLATMLEIIIVFSVLPVALLKLHYGIMKIAVKFSVGLQWLGFSEFIYVIRFIKNTLTKCFFYLHYELDFSVDSSSILVIEWQILLYVFVFIALQSGCSKCLSLSLE